ncbi:uncharacterized protein BO80DRAFT_428910 [Aspergillus ibericus CBS 121593]|uniref:Uncharacterized protein n=1 Tax=Aspergillus ibericus CBS 121593 TaxID=1448316 RepID=A0A395GMS5_9EURO|nr:hypothetical protein BO80DRAFT_428910 [Aspergillus ibericus CBS 121593]RAK96626.1 hypothetical protein BO80DRAFT_428910 [Aspergillus ibericus CBS 121593]
MSANANAPAPADMLAAFHRFLTSRSPTGKPPRYARLLSSPNVDLLLRSRLTYMVSGATDAPGSKTDPRDPQTAAEEAVHAIEMNMLIFGVTAILFVWSDVLNGTTYADALDPIGEEMFRIMFDSVDIACNIATYGEGFADIIATFSTNTNLTAAQRVAKIEGYIAEVRAHENDSRAMLTRLTDKSNDFVAAWLALGQESSRNAGQDLLDAEDLRIEFVANVGIQSRTWNTTVVDARMIESMLQMAVTMAEHPAFMQISLDRAVELYTANALHMRAFASKLTEWLDENDIDTDILDP